MFKTERVPVTLFQSTDEGAPQLTATAGSLKTILKACLVTGYGDKQALGWESAYEDGSYIAFRSKHEKASKCWLSVDNQYPRAVDVVGYHEMSAKNTGQKKFGVGSSSYYFSVLPDNRNSAQWLLVGHGRGFCLVVRSSYFNVNGSVFLYFGDFPSVAPSDSRNCIIIQSTGTNKSISSNEVGIGDMILGQLSGSQINTGQMALAASYDQLGFNVPCIGGGAMNKGRGEPYPNPISGGFTAFEIFVLEYYSLGSDNNYSMRGKLPGLLGIRERLPSIEELSFFDNLDDSGDRFVKFNTNHSQVGRDCFLLNCTAWEI
ncbi:hypothetical protein [Neisseria montereyensis]|uniref:TLDc domain-containing protein n=1 Tax=Neisseria montereyensis TaxID=2973938 RepID=A0ABT2FDH9_9NEIS|nr:hypothetical protein [Neisseria montereyensis]MCS4534236.1 hypothetical protein [Neisseria montereyensis]